MGRIVFFLAEAFRALRRSAAPSMAAIVTIVVTTVLLGVLIPVLSASASTNENVRNQIAALRVFLHDGGSKGEVKALEKRIERIPHVDRVVFVSKEEAKKRLEEKLKGDELAQSLQELNKNPLPPSYDVHFDDPDNRQAVVRNLYRVGGSGQEQFISPLIESLNQGGENAGKIDKITGNLKIFLAVLALLLLVASLLLVAN